MFSPLISICTSTYNRANVLHIPYNSLCTQTYKNIEWIIVDGGSSDDTSNLIENFIKSADFPIKYVQLEKSGKHIALNRLFEMASGELCFELDSDDALLPDAIESVIAIWNSIPNKDDYWAISGGCIDGDSGELVGTLYPDNINSLDPLTQRKMMWKTKGEKCRVRRTSILKGYKFPEIDGIRFISEDYVWMKIDAIYREWCTNKVLRVYYPSSDSLTNLSKFRCKTSVDEMMITNYYNCLLFINDIWGNYDKYYHLLSRQFIVTCVKLWLSILHFNYDKYTEFKKILMFRKKVIFAVSYVPAFVYYKLYRSKYL